jgi:hypothetical protein
VLLLGAQVKFKVAGRNVSLSVKGSVLIQGEMPGDVDVEYANSAGVTVLKTKGVPSGLEIELEKSGYAHWPCFVAGEASELEPEPEPEPELKPTPEPASPSSGPEPPGVPKPNSAPPLQTTPEFFKAPPAAEAPAAPACPPDICMAISSVALMAAACYAEYWRRYKRL